jgi:hypothetical protein
VKRSLLFASLCILTLPFLSLPAPGLRLARSASYCSIVFAGHATVSGAYCPCDPVGESCPCCGTQRISESPTAPEEGQLTKDLPPPTAEPNPDSEFIAGALFLVTGLFLWRYATNSIF